MAQNILGTHVHQFFLLAGVIEVIVGILVALPTTTRIAAYIASVWHLLITANLLACGHLYLDIALRDFGLALSAFALAKLTEALQTGNRTA